MPVLIRRAYREFLSLVEADLNLINQFNPYPNYIETAKLIQKFKKTSRHHSATFLKEKLNLTYQSASFKQFLEIKFLRDELTHPKAATVLAMKNTNYLLLKTVFGTYNDHVNALMVDIGVLTVILFFANYDE